MNNYVIVTSANNILLEKFARSNILSWRRRFSKDVKITLFSEDDISMDGVKTCVFNSNQLSFFKENADKNGIFNKRYNYSFDVIRFSFKSFSIINSARNFYKKADVLIWLDSDIYARNDISHNFLKKIAPLSYHGSFIGRYSKHSETGFLAFNLKEIPQSFFDKWEDLYLNGGIFKLDAFHDAEVFDVLRNEFCKLNWLNLSSNNRAMFCQNPFEKTILGLCFQHFKGGAKYTKGNILQ